MTIKHKLDSLVELKDVLETKAVIRQLLKVYYMYRKAKEVSYCFSLLSSLTKIHSWGNIKTIGL